MSEAPLSGKWHHGAGFLCCGTLRIAKEDFDTNPNDEFKTEMLGWICNALNEIQAGSDLEYVARALEQHRQNVVINCPQGVFEVDRTIYGISDNVLIIDCRKSEMILDGLNESLLNGNAFASMDSSRRASHMPRG